MKSPTVADCENENENAHTMLVSRRSYGYELQAGLLGFYANDRSLGLLQIIWATF